ncbi:uncharacterized protein LOC117064062 [Trachypithecus francoisi]|uniref:uncharacterized protein LOC117064062 n=1 Tax=Trachypithecus francoisi TaxID=54180 RepID=UPI00141AE347|nr:uncharacterized protein LOC117064062 [Trachypithecus francoisi]
MPRKTKRICIWLRLPPRGSPRLRRVWDVPCHRSASGSDLRLSPSSSSLASEKLMSWMCKRRPPDKIPSQPQLLSNELKPTKLPIPQIHSIQDCQESDSSANGSCRPSVRFHRPFSGLVCDAPNL